MDVDKLVEEQLGYTAGRAFRRLLRPEEGESLAQAVRDRDARIAELETTVASSAHALQVARCDRMGLVTVLVQGQPYVIDDIGLRMLQPRELFRAQGFPDDYVIGDDPAQGLSLPKTAQVRLCGNSVCPPIAAALVRANAAQAGERAA